MAKTKASGGLASRLGFSQEPARLDFIAERLAKETGLRRGSWDDQAFERGENRRVKARVEVVKRKDSDTWSVNTFIRTGRQRTWDPASWPGTSSARNTSYKSRDAALRSANNLLKRAVDRYGPEE